MIPPEPIIYVASPKFFKSVKFLYVERAFKFLLTYPEGTKLRLRNEVPVNVVNVYFHYSKWSRVESQLFLQTNGNFRIRALTTLHFRNNIINMATKYLRHI